MFRESTALLAFLIIILNVMASSHEYFRPHLDLLQNVFSLELISRLWVTSLFLFAILDIISKCCKQFIYVHEFYLHKLCRIK